MSDPFAVFRARAVAIATAGYGATGISAQATLRHVPGGRFRMGLSFAPLDDEAAQPALIDRACAFKWLSSVDGPDPADELDSLGCRTARFAWTTGYVYGAANTRWVHLASGAGETAAAAVKDPDGRALLDAERFRRAFQWPELYAGVAIDVGREGATTLEDMRDGRLIATTIYVAMLNVDMTASLDP